MASGYLPRAPLTGLGVKVGHHPGVRSFSAEWAAVYPGTPGNIVRLRRIGMDNYRPIWQGSR